MTTPRQADDRGEPPSPQTRNRNPNRNARARLPGRQLAPSAAILGSQLGSRTVHAAPWWSFWALTMSGLAAACLAIVFPQDSPDKLAWWRERRRAKHPCPCQAERRT